MFLRDDPYSEYEIWCSDPMCAFVDMNLLLEALKEAFKDTEFKISVERDSKEIKVELYM